MDFQTPKIYQKHNQLPKLEIENSLRRRGPLRVGGRRQKSLIFYKILVLKKSWHFLCNIYFPETNPKGGLFLRCARHPADEGRIESVSIFLKIFDWLK